MKLITDAMDLLEATGSLPQHYRPHKLSGNMNGIWECHIEPDWLMTWEQNDTQLTLLFLRTGTHADLFRNSPSKKNIRRDSLVRESLGGLKLRKL